MLAFLISPAVKRPLIEFRPSSHDPACALSVRQKHNDDYRLLLLELIRI